MIPQFCTKNFKMATTGKPAKTKPIYLSPRIILISRRSFRHLKHQNLSTGDDFIHSSGIIFLVPYLVTSEAVPPLANDPIVSGRSIQSFRHLEH